MEKLIEKLYEETYESKLTPYDLLQNLKLDNYHDITFSKIDDSLIATVFCDLVTGESAEFEYIFVNDKLDSLIQVSPFISQSVLYQRETEINKLRYKIKGILQTKVSNSA